MKMKKAMKKILGLIFFFLFVHTSGAIAQNQKALNNQFQPDKVYSTPELAGSGPSTKQVGVETTVSDGTTKLPPRFNVISLSRSTSSKTWPKLRAEIDAARRTLSDVTIYSGTYDQSAPQVAIDGSEIFVAFEDTDTQGGTYPYGAIWIYRSNDDGISWNSWAWVHSSSYRLSSPQIVLAGGYVVVSYQVGGYLCSARWRRSDGVSSISVVSSPIADNNDYVISHRIVSDVEKFPQQPWLYMAFIFKQADGSNKVLFSISKDTASSWKTYDSLGYSRAELGSASIGLDYGESGLYLAYLGTGANAGQIILRKSTNLGTTWTSEQILPITQYGGTNLKVGPMVAAVGKRVAIVYQYDYSGNATDKKTSDDFNINAVVSTDSGASWREQLVGYSARNEILPWITHDADGNMYVSFIKDGKVRVSMAGDEMKFSTPDSTSTANTSLDYFTSICGSNVPDSNKAYSAWTGISNGLDIFGTSIMLKIPPLSPTGLFANTVSSTQINLTWTDNSNNENGFKIYWSEGATGLYKLYATVGPDTSSYKCTGLLPSTPYSFFVTAFNDYGSSNGTNRADATTFTSGVPVIVSFLPQSGPIGTVVTVTGTNFDPTAANNIVYFGAVRALVTSATATSLSVTVPTGATYQPITVTTNGMTAYSNAPFIVTFAGGGVIDTNSFAEKIDFQTGSAPFDIAIGDVDGDGRPDVAVININSGNVSIFRNTSTRGNVSFAPRVDVSTGGSPYGVAIGDVDGDGKLDIAVANLNSNNVSIFRNTSTIGNVSFAPRIDIPTGRGANGVAIGDLDGDGKSDLVVTNSADNNMSVLRNTSTGDTVRFVATTYTTGNNPYRVAIGDVDGDGKPDIAVANLSGDNVSIFRNTGTSGNVNFAPRVDVPTGTSPVNAAISDLDGDGKPEYSGSKCPR